MFKTILAGAFAALALLALPLAACADSGHAREPEKAAEDAHHGAHGGGAAVSQPATLPGAWSALIAARDAIASDVESGALGEIHAKAEPLPALVAALLDQSRELDPGRLARVEGAAKQVSRVADALHVAADGGDAARTRKELTRLDGLLELIRAQYPAEALEADGHGAHGHEGHSAAPGNVRGGHAHMEPPAGIVEAKPQATVHVQAFDALRFDPKRFEVQAGVPTRIEVENMGAADHSLVVRTPGGERDWVHLHVPPGATEAATYELDEPGIYPVRCTIPGHTEGGMIGELVVVAGRGSARSHP